VKLRDGRAIGAIARRLQMRFLVIGMILSIALGGPLYAGCTLASYKSANGKGFVIDLFDADLLKSPAWKSTDENPPVSPGTALQLARKLRDERLQPIKERPWKLASTDLCHNVENVDRWYWEIVFERPTKGRDSTDEFRAIILMNGVVLQPREWKD
jgi:hypothetical protein